MATNVLSFPLQTERPTCGRPCQMRTFQNRIPVSDRPLLIK